MYPDVIKYNKFILTYKLKNCMLINIFFIHPFNFFNNHDKKVFDLCVKNANGAWILIVLVFL